MVNENRSLRSISFPDFRNRSSAGSCRYLGPCEMHDSSSQHLPSPKEIKFPAPVYPIMPRHNCSSDSRSRTSSPHPRHRRRRSYSRSRSPRRRRPSTSSPPPHNQSHHYRSRSPRPRHNNSHEDSSSHRRRDRSPSPYRRDRSRSRSPPRRKEAKSKMAGSSTGGFKWKTKAPPTTSTEEESRALDRGYRDHEKPQRLRSRSPIRDDVRSKFGDDYQSRYADRPSVGGSNDVASKFGGDTGAGNGADAMKDGGGGEEKKKEKKKKKDKVKGPKPTSEPMIIVNVNDRLGTKAQIACLGSDPVSKYSTFSSPSTEVHLWPDQAMLDHPARLQLCVVEKG